MEVLLFNFEKRSNSTKQVDDTTGTRMVCTLKDETSIINPVLFIQSSGLLEFTYAKIFGHYYFIDNITMGINNAQTMYLSMDFLASYKSQLLTNSCYVKYSSSDYSSLLIDQRVPILANSKFTEVDNDSGDVFTPLAGTYILQTISTSGNIFYAMQSGQDITRLLSELATLQSYDAFGLFQSAMDGIVSCSYVPISVENMSHSQLELIALGNWSSSNVFAYPIVRPMIMETIELNIPHHYNDFRMLEPYQRMLLSLPFVGIIPLSIKEFLAYNKIFVRMVGNVFTGTVEYTVSNGTNLISNSKFGGHFGYPIPVGLTTNSNLPQLGMSLLSATMSVLSGNVGGTISSVAQGASALGSTQTTMVGSAGGNYTEYINGEYNLFIEYSDTRIEPSNLTDICGRPCCKVVQLSTLNGYCETSGASVNIDCLDVIKTHINRLLDSGIYIE